MPNTLKVKRILVSQPAPASDKSPFSELASKHKIEIDFREFPELIRTEDGRKKLLDYCEQDVLLTLKLWNRFAGILV